jgi:hypothetical protein
MTPLFMGDDEELQTLIRDHLYSFLPISALNGDFHPSHIQEYAGDLLLAFKKPLTDGGSLRPSSAAKVGAGAPPASQPTLWGPISHILHLKSRIFVQTAGLKDGASHCAKILTSVFDLLNSNPNDPDVIIKIDIVNAFNVLSRQLTFDVKGARQQVITHAL